MATIPSTTTTRGAIRLPAELMGYGSRGEGVLALQQALHRAGFDPGAQDGVFGPDTLHALRAFQGAQGLAVDGLAGMQTRRVLEQAVAPREEAGVDTRSTWTQTGSTVMRNFGHRPVNDHFVHARADGRLVWSDSQTLVNRDQWAAMGAAQRTMFLQQVPESLREVAKATLENGVAKQAVRAVPKEPVPGPSQPPAPGSRPAQEMRNLLELAVSRSAGRRPDGMCYMHVWNFIERSGYGNMPGEGIPDSHAAYAKQFAEYADANLARLGLRKLAIDNPYKAPPGAIVVVRAGTPGTAHPIAGDIAVVTGRGWFANGGEMGYGGPGNFPPGNNYVLGVYVPA